MVHTVGVGRAGLRRPGSFSCSESSVGSATSGSGWTRFTSSNPVFPNGPLFYMGDGTLLQSAVTDPPRRTAAAHLF